ncbi:MAG TPA: hypothetical protein VN822_02215 [Candidatus Acidoferrales bacterium]|nr:hypothetical protein [Candidatus Acidoferrales bacterium]
MYALAEKIAAALTPARTFSLDVKDVSSGATVELAAVSQTLVADLTPRGARSVAPPAADSQVLVTISQNVDGYLLVAEIRHGDALQVATAPVKGSEPPASQPSLTPGIQRKIVWQQARPILDFVIAAPDTSHEIWYLLEPDRLVVFEFSGSAEVLHEARPISKLYAPRDLRGRVVLTDATHVKVFVGGVRCDGFWNPSFALECRENSDQQWQMGTVSWAIDPSRNNFSGAMTFSNSLEAKFPTFYSAASPSSATSGQSTSRWVVAGLDGRAQLFVGTADAVAAFDGWGSDILTAAPACGAAWQVFVTGAGDWTQPDRIQLYEIKDRRAIAVGDPLEFSGPILALWPAEDGKSAHVISQSLATGQYEASIVSATCGN